MPADLSHILSIGVSARALFDLEDDHQFFLANGEDAYRAYQKERFDTPPAPGAAFPLVKGLLTLNERLNREVVTVTLMSKNSPDLGHRLTRAASHYGLDIKRWAFTSGEPVGEYLKAYQIDLFLSRESESVEQAVDAGIAAGVVYPAAATYDLADAITFAFDGDAVIFSGESEGIYAAQGLEAFVAHEKENARNPMKAGPFGRLLKTLSSLQAVFDAKDSPVRIAIVTARNAPAHERVLHTLDAWDIRVDQMFLLGGLPKAPFLQVLKPHIFIDDQDAHAAPAAQHVPSARVPFRAGATAVDVAGAKMIGADTKETAADHASPAESELKAGGELVG
ncbi:5'-nucleotidase [Azospirillum sp. sgz302134]